MFDVICKVIVLFVYIAVIIVLDVVEMDSYVFVEIVIGTVDVVRVYFNNPLLLLLLVAE